MKVEQAIGLGLAIRQGLIAGRLYNPTYSFFGNKSFPPPPDKTMAEIHGGTYGMLLNNNIRIPSNIIALNPLNMAPTIAGFKYFGQNPAFRVSMDMPFAKPIGSFTSAISGCASNIFSMLNNILLMAKQGISLLSAVAVMLTGKFITDIATPLFGFLSSTIGTLGIILSAAGVLFLPSYAVSSVNGLTDSIGGYSNYYINLTDKNSLVPFVSSLSSIYSTTSDGNSYTNSPFNTDLVSQAAVLASEVRMSLNLTSPIDYQISNEERAPVLQNLYGSLERSYELIP